MPGQDAGPLTASGNAGPPYPFFTAFVSPTVMNSEKMAKVADQVWKPGCRAVIGSRIFDFRPNHGAWRWGGVEVSNEVLVSDGDVSVRGSGHRSRLPRGPIWREALKALQDREDCVGVLKKASCSWSALRALCGMEPSRALKPIHFPLPLAQLHQFSTYRNEFREHGGNG